MAALRSLKDEVNGWDQRVDDLLARGIRNKFDLAALRHAQDKLNQARDAFRKQEAA